MQFVTVGIDHSTAPLAVRERFALAGPALDAALARLRMTGLEGLILSTCSRTEYFALASSADIGSRVLTELLNNEARSTGPVSEHSFTSQSGEAAVHRLFAIASGTRSMVTGESDILRQLKQALARATAAGTAGQAIHRLATAALAVGKRVRQTTEIGRRRASVVSVALDRARESLSSSSMLRVIIVGTGDTAAQTIDYLERRPLCDDAVVTVVGRCFDRVPGLGHRLDACRAPWDALPEVLETADLVVCCTAAPGAVIEARMILAAQRARRHAPMILVDLATPRDVDPMVRNVGGVTVIDLDEIETIARREGDRHGAAVTAAETIVGEHVSRYLCWWRSRQAAPTITAVVARGTAIRNQEVARIMAQLPDLTAVERQAIERMALRLTNKLLHGPLAALNREPDSDMMDAVNRIFELGAGSREQARDRPANIQVVR